MPTLDYFPDEPDGQTTFTLVTGAGGTRTDIRVAQVPTPGIPELAGLLDQITAGAVTEKRRELLTPVAACWATTQDPSGLQQAGGLILTAHLPGLLQRLARYRPVIVPAPGDRSS